MTNELLDLLIQSLQEYADSGVYDPWFLSDGSTVQPLDVLKELRVYRRALDAIADYGEKVAQAVEAACQAQLQAETPAAVRATPMSRPASPETPYSPF